MRTISSILVGILALVAFCGFFLLHSVLSYIESPKLVTETAKTHNLRTLAYEAADLVLMHQLHKTGLERPKLRDFIQREARSVFQEVLSSEWFYQTFATGYRGVLDILEGREIPEKLDLQDRKVELMNKLEVVAEDVVARCEELIGGSVCRDRTRHAEILFSLRAAITAAIAEIPDRLDIQLVATTSGNPWLDSDSDEVKRAREYLHAARLAHKVALVALLLFLFVIGFTNRPPLSRMLLALGLVVSVSSGVYIAGVNMMEEEMQERVRITREGIHLSTTPISRDGTVGDITALGAETLTLGAAHDSVHGSDRMVVGLGAGGIGCIVLGVLIWRRRPSGTA